MIEYGDEQDEQDEENKDNDGRLYNTKTKKAQIYNENSEISSCSELKTDSIEMTENQ